jgi:hypothetical protein
MAGPGVVSAVLEAVGVAGVPCDAGTVGVACGEGVGAAGAIGAIGDVADACGEDAGGSTRVGAGGGGGTSGSRDGEQPPEHAPCHPHSLSLRAREASPGRTRPSYFVESAGSGGTARTLAMAFMKFSTAFNRSLGVSESV